MDTTTTHAAHQELGHVVPKRVLIGIWLALMVLTVATVAVTYVDLGRLNIWVALIIALVKASLVGLYFMHLRYDGLLHSFILVVALSVVALFIISTITDTGAYQETMQTPTGWTTSP